MKEIWRTCLNELRGRINQKTIYTVRSIERYSDEPSVGDEGGTIWLTKLGFVLRALDHLR